MMPTAFFVPITQRHINQGKPGDACSCALAMSITEAVAAVLRVSVVVVGDKFIRITYNQGLESICFRVYPAVREFIYTYDRDLHLAHPCTLVLAVTSRIAFIPEPDGSAELAEVEEPT